MTYPRVDSPLPIFDRFPALRDCVAWKPIGHWPTPILSADAFATCLGLKSLHIKREDLSHPDCGGNKTRGLEFLLARAVERGARCIVTFSSAGSHHISKTAWHARRFGIDTTGVFVDQPVSEYVRRNIGIAIASGAHYVRANRLTVIPKTAMAFLRESWRSRRRRASEAAGDSRSASTATGHVYFVAPGGTTRRSMLGHVNAALELKAQVESGALPEPDYIYVVLGSLGTAAGLALGLKLAGMSSRVVGVTVSYRWYCTPRRIARFARRVNAWMRRMDPSVPDVSLRPGDLDVVHTALGDGYALFTQRGETLARRLFQTQGLRTDGTYTAKALDGMMQYIESRKLRESKHLFWHTYFDFPPCDMSADEVPSSVRRYFNVAGQPWAIDDGAPLSTPASPANPRN